MNTRIYIHTYIHIYMYIYSYAHTYMHLLVPPRHTHPPFYVFFITTDTTYNLFMYKINSFTHVHSYQINIIHKTTFIGTYPHTLHVYMWGQQCMNG